MAGAPSASASERLARSVHHNSADTATLLAGPTRAAGKPAGNFWWTSNRSCIRRRIFIAGDFFRLILGAKESLQGAEWVVKQLLAEARVVRDSIQDLRRPGPPLRLRVLVGHDADSFP